MVFDIQDTFASLAGIDAVETRAILKVNGKKYNKWKSISINRSIVQISGSFSFTTANIHSGNNERWNITTGDRCEIEVAGKTVITGYIDDIDNGYDLGSHDITFGGRDKTADLVDCTFDVNPEPEIRSVGSFPYVPPAGEGEFKNLSFLQIIEKLCKPFDIDVVLDTELLSDSALFAVIAEYKPETGSMVYEEIATFCQQYGVLPISIGDGTLYITRAGSVRANDTLEAGVNIKSASLNQSDTERYSVYYVEGIAKTTVFNQKSSAFGSLTDDYVKRYRPLYILAGEQAINDDVCQKRAAWEARVRAGASRKVEMSVYKWTQTNGDVWPLNGVVPVKDDKIGVVGDRLIAGIDLTIDNNGGELTKLSLVPPDTFALKERVPIPNETDTLWDDIRNLK